MRLDGVEIKASIVGAEVAAALQVLDVGGRERRRSVGFIEDCTVGTALPLFHQGVVLRVRQTDGDKGDSTVKLRPCRRSQLTEKWLGQDHGDGWKLRIEEDWAGPRRVLATSCVSDLPRGRIDSARAETEPLRRLFNGGQERFLADCAGIRINLDALTLLPPIAATRWDDVQIGVVDGAVAERWSIDELDFLELSIRVDTVAEAPSMQGALDREVHALGLELDDANESKTERVLEYLVGLAAAGS